VLLGRSRSLDMADALFGPVREAQYPNPTAKTGASHLTQRLISG
jgi:hypothetical protein